MESSLIMLPKQPQFPSFQTGRVPLPPPLPKHLTGDYKELSEMLSIQKKQQDLLAQYL
jgi:hypothetical protein